MVKFSVKIQRVKIFGDIRRRNVATAELDKNNHQYLVKFSSKIQRVKIFGNIREKRTIDLIKQNPN